MYNVMLVEDELKILEGLKNTIDWNAMGLSIKLGCSDGECALKALYRNLDIDIVITDIRMPYKDGLELLRQIKEYDSSIKVILLSGFEEFEYAKQGLNEGASAFISKLSVHNEIEKVVERVIKEIEKDRLVAYERKNTEVYRYAMLKEYFKGLLFKESYFKADIDNSIILDISSYLFSVGVLRVNNYYQKQVQENADWLFEEIEFWIKEKELSNIRCFVVKMKENEIVILVSTNRYNKEYFLSEIKKIYDEIMVYITKIVKNSIKYVLGVGVISKGDKGAIDSYKNAKEITYYDNLYKDKSIVFNYEINHSEKLKDKNIEIMKYERKILNAYEMKNLEKINSTVDKLFGYYLNNKLQSTKEVQNDFIRLFNLILWRFSESSKDQEKILNNVCETIKGINTIVSIKITIKKCFEELFDAFEKNSKKDIERIVKSIEKYIESNFMERITLDQISDYVYLHPSYISIVFKQVTGKSFTDYVIEYKMKKAKEFILSDMLVSEAMLKVGYKDTKHFRKMFKKYIGHNPGEIIR